MFDNAYILFVKYPEPGKVKTRLARAIGDDKAAELYKALVERLVATLDTTYDTLIFTDRADKEADFREWLGDRFRYFPQKGDDLGARMFNSLRYVLDLGYKKAVLTGSDIPELRGAVVKDAFALLEERDAVIGKTSDGGYYLIGFNDGTLKDRVFCGINWSTDIVFSQTMHIFRSMRYSVAETVPLSDLDTLEDLIKLKHTFKEITEKIELYY